MRVVNRVAMAVVFTAAISFAGTLSAAVAINTVADGQVIEFAIDGVEFTPAPQDVGKYVVAALQGVEGFDGIAYKVGQPQVPVLRFYVTGEVDVQLGATEEIGLIAGGRQIWPNQPSRVKIPGKRPAVEIDHVAYSQVGPVAKSHFEVKPAGSVRGVPRYEVTIFPLSYVASTGQWHLAKTVKVGVKGRVISGRYARVEGQPAASPRLVMVVGPAFAASPALVEYVALKQRLGFVVDRLEVQPNESPDSVRARLRALYQQTTDPFEFVMLVGDVDQVPAQHGTQIDGLTDHYYRVLDTEDYVSDIGSPDVALGRISVRDEAQLGVVLGKLARYQSEPTGDDGWRKRASFIASDDQWEITEGSHNYVIQTHMAPRGFTGDFPQIGTTGGDQLFAQTNRADGTMVIDMARRGRGLVVYSGHGSGSSWVLPYVDQLDIRQIDDPNALPLVLSFACDTGKYELDLSMSESWLRYPKAAVAVLASVDLTFWEEDDLLERSWFDTLFAPGSPRIGSITNAAIGAVWRHYGGAGKSAYYWETYNILGDPSVSVALDSLGD